MTAVQQLLSLIPDAAEIKAYISEHDADEKMLDQWLWERIYKSKDWLAIEKQQIVEAAKKGLEIGVQNCSYDKLCEVIECDYSFAFNEIEQYYSEKYGTTSLPSSDLNERSEIN